MHGAKHRLIVPVAMILFVTTSGYPTQVAQSPKTPYNPTIENLLPDAILGKARQPGGRTLNYFSEDTASTGYLAKPEHNTPHRSVGQWS